MALLVIKGSDGKPHLVHSSQILRIPRAQAEWDAVWARFDARTADRRKLGAYATETGRNWPSSRGRGAEIGQNPA
jgi:hypothetical protein